MVDVKTRHGEQTVKLVKQEQDRLVKSLEVLRDMALLHIEGSAEAAELLDKLCTKHCGQEVKS